MDNGTEHIGKDLTGQRFSMLVVQEEIAPVRDAGGIWYACSGAGAIVERRRTSVTAASFQEW